MRKIVDIKARRKSRRTGRVIREAEAYKGYEISESQYRAMLQRQGEKCAICFQSETAKDKNGNVIQLAVDHNHRTGEVRGILCSRCNRAIGLLKDSVDNLERAIEYLESI